MTKHQYPSEKQDQYMLRLPEGMRDRIKAVAAANNRSMNAEIVATLQEKYPEPVEGDLDALISDLLARLYDVSSPEDAKTLALDFECKLKARKDE